MHDRGAGAVVLPLHAGEIVARLPLVGETAVRHLLDVVVDVAC